MIENLVDDLVNIHHRLARLPQKHLVIPPADQYVTPYRVLTQRERTRFSGSVSAYARRESAWPVVSVDGTLLPQHVAIRQPAQERVQRQHGNGGGLTQSVVFSVPRGPSNRNERGGSASRRVNIASIMTARMLATYTIGEREGRGSDVELMRRRVYHPHPGLPPSRGKECP